MRPIPETEQALDELDAFDAPTGDEHLRLHLRAGPHRVRSLVPSCRGMGLTLPARG